MRDQMGQEGGVCVGLRLGGMDLTTELQRTVRLVETHMVRERDDGGEEDWDALRAAGVLVHAQPRPVGSEALLDFVTFISYSALDTDGRWFALARHESFWYGVDNEGGGDYTVATHERGVREYAIDAVAVGDAVDVPGATKVLNELVPSIMTLLRPFVAPPQQQSFGDDFLGGMSDDDDDGTDVEAAESEARAAEYDARAAARNQFVFQPSRGEEEDADGVDAPTPEELFVAARALSSEAFAVVAGASQPATAANTATLATALLARCKAALRGGEHSVFAHSHDYVLDASEGQCAGNLPSRCLFYSRLLGEGGDNDAYATSASDDLVAALRRLCVLCAHDGVAEFSADDDDDDVQVVAVVTATPPPPPPALPTSGAAGAPLADAQTVVMGVLDETHAKMRQFRRFGRNESQLEDPDRRDAADARVQLNTFLDETAPLRAHIAALVGALDAAPAHPTTRLCAALVRSCNLSLHLLLSRNCVVGARGDRVVYAYPATLSSADVGIRSGGAGDYQPITTNMREMEENAQGALRAREVTRAAAEAAEAAGVAEVATDDDDTSAGSGSE